MCVCLCTVSAVLLATPGCACVMWECVLVSKGVSVRACVFVCVRMYGACCNG